MNVTDNGTLIVPMRAEGPDGTLGDGGVEIGPSAPDWSLYLRSLAIRDDEDTRKMDRIRGAGYCRRNARRFPGDKF